MEQYLQNSAGKKMVLKTITPIQLNRQQPDLRQSGNRTTPWGNSVNHVDDWNKELRNGEATVKRMLNLESSKAVWFSGSHIAIHFQSLPLSVYLPLAALVSGYSLPIVASGSSTLTFYQLGTLCGKRVLFLQSISEKLLAWSSFALLAGLRNEPIHRWINYHHRINRLLFLRARQPHANHWEWRRNGPPKNSGCCDQKKGNGSWADQ